jgi:hypothetical protein
MHFGFASSPFWDRAGFRPLYEDFAVCPHPYTPIPKAARSEKRKTRKKNMMMTRKTGKKMMTLNCDATIARGRCFFIELTS